MPSPRVIIDTDPGIDDAQSILFAFLCRQFEIDAVTSVFGNVPVELAALNDLRLVELGGLPGCAGVSGRRHRLHESRRGWDSGLVRACRDFVWITLPRGCSTRAT